MVMRFTVVFFNNNGTQAEHSVTDYEVAEVVLNQDDPDSNSDYEDHLVNQWKMCPQVTGWKCEVDSLKN